MKASQTELRHNYAAITRLIRGLAPALLLAGCAGRVPPPAIEARVVTVDRVVAVTCVRREQIPAEPAKIGDRLTGDAAHDLPVVAVSALRLRAWGGQLAALLTGCVLAE